MIGLGALLLVLAQAQPQSPVSAANTEAFGVRTQVGAMVVTTSEDTTLTPTLWADAEGPLAYGDGKSLGRIGARIGLTGQPGQGSQTFTIDTYKGVEVGLRLGRIVGVLGGVRTAVRAEYSFTTLIKGATQERPVSGLSHAGGIGLSFNAPTHEASAELTVFAAFDEATTTCSAPIVCTGLHSGFAIVIYGQVPILDGKVLFAGDVSIPTALSGNGVTKHSVERVYMALDPVALFRK